MIFHRNGTSTCRADYLQYILKKAAPENLKEKELDISPTWFLPTTSFFLFKSSLKIRCFH